MKFFYIFLVLTFFIATTPLFSQEAQYYNYEQESNDTFFKPEKDDIQDYHFMFGAGYAYGFIDWPENFESGIFIGFDISYFFNKLVGLQADLSYTYFWVSDEVSSDLDISFRTMEIHFGPVFKVLPELDLHVGVGLIREAAVYGGSVDSDWSYGSNLKATYHYKQLGVSAAFHFIEFEHAYFSLSIAYYK